MLLFFVVFVFCILHIQFLIRNIFFGASEANFFMFTIKYGFDRAIAIQSLLFSVACTIGFIVGYKLVYRARKASLTAYRGLEVRVLRKEIFLLQVSGAAMIAYMSFIMVRSGFNYTLMVMARESTGFIFELRVIFLLFLSHILLNHSWRELSGLSAFKGARRVVFLYFVCTVLFQARSAVFELGAIIAYSLLVRTGDNVKIKYVICLFAVMLVPNIIILGRLGIPEDPKELIENLFSFEYAILFNNYLSAAISAGAQGVQEFTFVTSLKLLIPSPIRDALGMMVVKSEYYTDIAIDANNSGGGFSLLAEMYSNFRWYATFVFAGFGMLIGHWNARASRPGGVSLRYAAAPLMYVAFILAFRNDFGVFLKYAVQLLMIAWFVSLFFPPGVDGLTRSGRPSSTLSQA